MPCQQQRSLNSLAERVKSDFEEGEKLVSADNSKDEKRIHIPGKTRSSGRQLSQEENNHLYGQYWEAVRQIAINNLHKY